MKSPTILQENSLVSAPEVSETPYYRVIDELLHSVDCSLMVVLKTKVQDKDTLPPTGAIEVTLCYNTGALLT